MGIVLKTATNDEAFHITIALGLNTVYRYAFKNETVYNLVGEIGDGTTVDLDEPFVIYLSCDTDGWVLKVNDERSYPHFLHILPFTEIQFLEVSGDADMSFVGFGDKNMKPAPSTTFNITYKCPPGTLFHCLLVKTFYSDQ